MESVAQQHPVDLGHLARYTGGEAALDAEILQLFATQSAGILRELGGVLEMRDAIRWRQIVHSLKGAAMGIGAFGLADAAAEAQGVDPSLQHADARRGLSAVNAKADAVWAFIAAYLAA